ncbi:U32 family peptidase [Bacteroidales bacterium OttesenSCG-928-I21]|nr:U32 family peptidase [Bacteroidales bacterium OttesenSCG-928-I21]
MYKPELLIPAGNLESFFAALNGGADAVYLGLKSFNARMRAKNFSYQDLHNMVCEAHFRQKKVYVTLNTLVKNEEIPNLIDVLGVLSQIDIDALIIQDFAVLNLVKKNFRKLKIHSSTQMAVHNSAGCNFFEKQGFERTILSRELTAKELKNISKNSKIEKEIFVHGALCYSFSGYCLFSSYLGGSSANRGLCAQICRRNFASENIDTPFFSLKDFQLIDLIPLFSQLGISSLKVEGRMKNPEYIYNTARAYRMAIDDHTKIPEAKEVLKYDFAREKTSWFMGKDLQNSISSYTGTGIFIGKIVFVKNGGFEIESKIHINLNSKLRIRNIDDTEAEYLKINKVECDENKYFIYTNSENISVGMSVFLVGTNSLNFKTKFSNYNQKKFLSIGLRQKEIIKYSFKLSSTQVTKSKLYIRISKVEDIFKIDLSLFEAVFLKFRYCEFEKLLKTEILPDFKKKLFIEFPKFISEIKIQYVRQLGKRFVDKNFNNFVISHISQIELLPKNVNINCNENVYLLNDIAISYIQSLGIKNYCYPLETDYPNLLRGFDRSGIIPLYFYPELFYSRMPIKTGEIILDSKKKYKKTHFNGFTIITDSKPVSVTHNVRKFKSKGFHKFLVDMSTESNIEKYTAILKLIEKSERYQASVEFNMKKGLK